MLSSQPLAVICDSALLAVAVMNMLALTTTADSRVNTSPVACSVHVDICGIYSASGRRAAAVTSKDRCPAATAADMLIALLGLYYTIRDHQRKHYHHLLCQLLPDSTYRVDLAYDASAALWWFVLLIAMAIVDSRYMSALGLTLSTLNPDPLSAAVIALPVLVLVVCVVLAVFSGLMWKEMRRQNTRIVPQTFTTVYNI